MNPDRQQTDWMLLRRVAPYLRKNAALYGVALFCAPLSAALVVAQPWLLKHSIDEYLVPGDVEGLKQFALYYLVAVVLGFIAESLYTLFMSYAAMHTIRRIRSDVYRHSVSRAQAFFDREPTGRLLTRATSDIEALGETLTAGSMTIIVDILLMVGILGTMFTMEPRLTLALLLCAPPLAFAIEQIRRRLRRLFLQARTALATLNTYLTERLNGLSVVQLYSDEKRTMEGFQKRNLGYRDLTIQANVWDAILFALIDGVSSMCIAGILWYGASDALSDVMTIGLLAGFLDYIGRLFRPIREFSGKLAIIQRATSALEKIFSLLDEDDAIASGTEMVEPGPVNVRNLRFAYQEGETILKGVDLTINPGEVVAVVGRTGSGKSTLSKLLSRAYQGYEGTIHIGETELRSANLASLRRVVGVVHQDVHLFAASVKFNLTLGSEDAAANLRHAIAMCHAESTIERLGGLDGQISDKGGNLSAGEAQLLAFTRTLAFDTSIVILDEATSSVDSITEMRLQQATDVLLSSKTVLVIAHRLSTIMRADRILVMDGGQVIERGNHEALMSKKGAYAELFHKQFASTDEG